jgi:hypothetical protein
VAVRSITSDYVLAYPEEFPREDNQAQEISQVNDDLEGRECILNALKNLKLKTKTLTIVINNSNNYISFSILSGKSEEAESGFDFMTIEEYKLLFKW